MGKYTIRDTVVPKETVEKWQKVVDCMASVFDVPAGLIMRIYKEYIEVFVSCRDNANPYAVGASEHLFGKLYCETVLNTDEILYIDNALDYPEWKDNPDISLNMTSYLGVPIHWPGGEMFGTICVLDSKSVTDTEPYRNLLKAYRGIIEEELEYLK